jgi:hypothetical protein
MGMGYVGLRVLIAILCIILFLIGYSCLLLNALSKQVQTDDMLPYLIKMDVKKLLICLAYFVSNSIMCLTYKSQFEKEVLITGILSLATIGLINFMHYFGIFIMSTQAALITFNSITILFFILIYTFGKLNDLFYDRE